MYYTILNLAVLSTKNKDFARPCYTINYSLKTNDYLSNLTATPTIAKTIPIIHARIVTL